MAKAKTKPAKRAAKQPAAKKQAAKPTAKKPAAARPAQPPPAKAPAGPVLRGLRTSIYKVTDLARGKQFYGALLGREPYFDQAFYVGYDVDGHELGLDPDVSRIAAGPGGTIAYWRVDDLHASWEHALSHGGEPVEPPHNVGEGVDVALVQDPFGNYLGLIALAN